jgi:hypothetical protein
VEVDKLVTDTNYLGVVRPSLHELSDVYVIRLRKQHRSGDRNSTAA